MPVNVCQHRPEWYQNHKVRRNPCIIVCVIGTEIYGLKAHEEHAVKKHGVQITVNA